MANNYFAIERGNGRCVDHVVLQTDSGDIAFKDLMDMSYEDMKAYEDLELFVTATMNASNECFGENDDQTCITLVGEDGAFIWGILMGPGETDDDIMYSLIDWCKDGHIYKYAEEN